MNPYPTIFDSIPLEAVQISILQTFSIYWLLILGLKIVGRRVFGELGPQDFIVLLLIAESTNLGIVHQNGGYWSAIASVLTILAIGAATERITPIRKFLEGSPKIVLKEGEPLQDEMRRSLVQKEDLQSTAREYGFPDFSVFETMVLENDGRLTGVLKPEYRGMAQKIDSHKPID